MAYHSINFYSPAILEKESGRKGYISGNVIKPVKVDVEILREAHKRIDNGDMVRDFHLSLDGGFVQNYLIEGGVFVAVIHILGKPKKMGIEFASRHTSALKDALHRLVIPTFGIERLL